MKPVPKTIGADKFELEQIRYGQQRPRIVDDGYDSSAPMARSSKREEVIG